jgi:hypothetical protein
MAIVTNKFRVSAASSFASTFGTDSMYLVLGRPQSWDDTSNSTTFSNQSNGTPADNNPPAPYDNAVNEYAFWRDAMAGVKLNSSDVKLVMPRYNWQPSVKFDMYQHNINAANPTVNGVFNLADSNMLVYVTSTGNVYKCLFNGRSALTPTGIISTVQPSTTGTAPETTADGYIWKFMYNISSADADFVTASYLPVPTTNSVSTSNGIHAVLVEAAGTGYTVAPTITVYGDGTGCTVTANISGTSVSTITVNNPGTGYTWAKLVFTGAGTGAQALAMIAPQGGHGANLRTECHAFNVMIAGTVTGYQNTDVPVNQDFRSVALVKNPYLYTSGRITSAGTVASITTGRISKTLAVTSTTAVTPDIIITGGSSGAQGYVVFQSSGTTRIEYIQPVPSDVPQNIALGQIDVSTGALKQFVDGEPITGLGYSETLSSNGATIITPELQPYSGDMVYLDYRQPVTRQSGQNEKINIVINF